MSVTEWPRRGSVSPCFHPEDAEEEGLDLHLKLTGIDSRELGLLRADAAVAEPVAVR